MQRRAASAFNNDVSVSRPARARKVYAMPDGSLNSRGIASLVEPGRVHRRVYTDPTIFELEMERLFGRSWLYVGHATQVPNPGDFFTTDLGRQPVIMTRHHDGSVRVVLNRCTHRGIKLVAERQGNRQRFICLYHGWTYDPDGTLLRVPVEEGCAPGFKLCDFNLAKAPRIGIYRGFVFASLSPSGIAFDDWIAPMRQNIDDIVDRAPGGEIALDVGMHRYLFRGNWKMQAENAIDSYHVPFSHASTVNNKGVQFSRREGDDEGAKVVEGQRTAAQWKQRRSYDVGNGHGWTSNTELNEAARSSAVYDEYRATLAAAVGEDRMEQILTPRMHNSLLYPNASFMGLNMHIRVIKPLAVDLTEVNIYPVRLVGAPEAMNARNTRLLNVTHAAASFVQSDDLEAFARAQSGLKSQHTDWVDISRGLGREEPVDPPGTKAQMATDEMIVRAQFRAWLHYMCEE
jgi:phenylpropionate dioxygenase-like ring-hydroxylating dioxygenase large terminal subunit